MSISHEEEKVSQIAMLRSSDLLLTIFMQYTLLGIQFSLFSLAGSVLILSSSLLVLFFKLVDKRPTAEETLPKTDDKKDASLSPPQKIQSASLVPEVASVNQNSSSAEFVAADKTCNKPDLANKKLNISGYFKKCFYYEF